MTLDQQFRAAFDKRTARLNRDVARRLDAVPLVINDEVAVVLYADQGADGECDRQSWPAIIEVLARHASRALEVLTAQHFAKSYRPVAVASRHFTQAHPARCSVCL